MVFTVDYNTSEDNDLLSVSKSNRYETHDIVPDIDYGHMHSQSALRGDRTYDIGNHRCTVDGSPLIVKTQPECLKTRSKNVTLFMANTDVLSEFANKSHKPNTNYNLLSDSEKEIRDTYYLDKPSAILPNDDHILKPANFKVAVSDIPNRNIPMIQNIEERIIKKTGDL